MLVRQRPSNMASPWWGVPPRRRTGIGSVQVPGHQRVSGDRLTEAARLVWRTYGRPRRPAAGRSTAGGRRATRSHRKIRNVALVGHGGAGKTTLAEALLRRGRGHHPRRAGSRTAPPSCDFDPEEQRARHLAVAGARPVRVEGPQDQPDRHPRLRRLRGRRRRRAAGRRPRRVRGQRGRGRRGPDRGGCGGEAAELGLPRHGLRQQARPRAGRRSTRTLDQLRDGLRRRHRARSSCPIGEEAGFRGVADLLTDTAHIYDGGERTSGRDPRRHGRRSSTRSTTTSSRASSSADDDLLERYLDGDMPVGRGARAHARPRRRDGHASSRWCAARPPSQHRRRPAGRLHLRDRPLPARPARRSRSRPATPPSTVAADPAGEPLALVFKTIADPYVGPGHPVQGAVGHRSGPTTTWSTPAPAPTSACTACSTLRGKEHVEVGRACPPATSAPSPSWPTPAPATRSPPRASPSRSPAPSSARARSLASPSRAATPGRRGQAGHRPAPAAARRTRRCVSSATTRPTRPCCGAWARPTCRSRSSGWPGSSASTVDTEDVQVPYRETITGTGEAEGKLQEADRRARPVRRGVARASSPCERGEGFEFVDEIVGGAIPRQFIPAVEKGVDETMGEGGVLRLPGRRRQGAPASTASTTPSTPPRWLQDGAAGWRFRDGDGRRPSRSSSSRSPASWSPCPPSCRATSWATSTPAGAGCRAPSPRPRRRDGHRRRGPRRRAQRYAIDLRSMTGGRGRFAAEHDHYDLLPAHLAPTPRGSGSDD